MGRDRVVLPVSGDADPGDPEGADGGEGAAGADLLSALELSRPRVAALIARWTAAGVTVAAAESLTGGLLTAALTEIPGSSAVVRGAIVCYATQVKADLVGVDRALLASVGPVHPEVAAQLAEGVRARLDATVGVSLTGVAGPDPQEGRPAGTVFLGHAEHGRTRVYRLETSHSLLNTSFPASGRAAIRAAAVRAAVRILAGPPE